MPCDHSTSFNGLIQDSKSLKKSLNSSISSDNPLWRSKSFAEGINPDISFSYIKDPTFFDKKMPSLASLNLSNSLTSQTKNYPPYLKSPFEMRLKPLNNCPNLNGPVKGLYCTKNTYYSDSQLKKHLSLDASSISSFGSSGSGSISRNSTVLGDTYSSLSNINNKKFFQSFSSTWSSKPPKAPRPERAFFIFQAIEKGLRDCIELTQSDILLLKSSIRDGIGSVGSAQWKLYGLEKQFKAAERYLKQLEFQLAKVEELRDQYDIHLKMKDGVQTMAIAYAVSHGKDRDSALASVKSGIKECTETLCSIESKLEMMMGSLHLEMKGMQGFARLCPGDVFEITIKYGDNQKWKTRGKILKNGNQIWESQQVLMKALLGDIFIIRAIEVRGIGKNVTLGNKSCETKDLFTAKPQLMTLSLNAIGTLKLNLVITWNPLHGIINETGISISRSFTSASSLIGLNSSRTLINPISSLSSINKSKYLSSSKYGEIIDADYYLHRIPSPKLTNNNSEEATATSTSNSPDSRGSSLHLTGTSGFGSASGSRSSYCGSSSMPNSTLTSPETELMPSSKPFNNKSPSINNLCPTKANNRLFKNSAKFGQEMIVEATVHQNEPSHKNDDDVCSSEELNESSQGQPNQVCLKKTNQVTSVESLVNFYFNIGDSLVNLLSSLEDIQGQYSELRLLHESVMDLYKLLKQIGRFRGQSINNNNVCSTKDIKKIRTPNAHKRWPSTCSDISVSIENALECFDFLDQAVTDSDGESSPEHGVNFSQSIKKSKSCYTPLNNLQPMFQRNEKDSHQINFNSNPNLSPFSNGSTPSPIDSPQPLSSGSEQLDIALMSHLIYCQKLIENLGSFGPLKKREQNSLIKLQNQALVINQLHRLCSNLFYYFKVYQEKISSGAVNLAEMKCLETEYQQKQEKEINFLKEDVRIQKIWDTISYQHCSVNAEEIGSILISVTSEQFAQTLESYMKAFLTPYSSSYSNLSFSNSSSNSSLPSFNNKTSLIYNKIAKVLTSRILDCPCYESDYIVTIFQAKLFFKNDSSSLEHLFKSLWEEITLLNLIHSRDAVELKKALNKIKKSLPPKEPLFAIALLLLDKDSQITNLATSYFQEANKNKQLRNAFLSNFSEGLEMDSLKIRQASCLVLKLLKATEYVEHLAYISFADTSKEVREQAKETLFSCGSVGRKLYEDSQLFAHGFQGFAVK